MAVPKTVVDLIERFDRLVYDPRSLTEEEIRIVEEVTT